MEIRQPIIATLGHVDHCKTTLLDRIRGTSIASSEAGGITQAIGTTVIPAETIREIAGPVIDKFHFSVSIPGLLFIDTPGHEAFSTLRKRGGSISDLAILVVDINEGIMPQTQESINILKNFRVPFVVAMNKIDRIQGWQSGASFLENVKRQHDDVKNALEESFYKVVEQFSSLGINVERFDRIQDFTKKVAAVPISGQTGEGLPELLAILTGLSQQFLKERLKVTGHAKGSVMEVKELVGMGTTIDAIIYDGTLTKGEYLVIGGSSPFVTKIRSLLLPQPMKDIRTEKKFRHVDSVSAASGVKIAAPGLENAGTGAPIASAKNEDEAQKILAGMEKPEDVEIRADTEGIIIRAETVGSLEAMLNIFSKYPIREAVVGGVTRETVLKAFANTDEKLRVVMCFNTKSAEDVVAFAKERGVDILTSNVIYHLNNEYTALRKAKDEKARKSELENVVRAAKIRLLPGFVFRASNPAVVGCEILGGILKPGAPLMKDGAAAGKVKQMENQGETVQEARTGEKIAVSIDGLNIGRAVKEGDILVTDISENDYRRLLRYPDFVSDSERAVLREIEQLRRSEKPSWGM